MRTTRQKQMPLMPGVLLEHDQAKELDAISRILNQHPAVYDLVYQDLCSGSPAEFDSGARGMTAEQVLRAAIVKALFGYPYRQLAFHIVDSRCLKTFCLIGLGGKGFKKSVLQKNIKALSSRTWEQINVVLVGHAKEEKIETGREVRVDCTAVESDIHPPTDSALLFDGVRVLIRLLIAAQALGVPGLLFHDHGRRAKRRMPGIHNTRKENVRKRLYADLIQLAKWTVGYARQAIVCISGHDGNGGTLMDFLEPATISDEMKHFIPLVEQVISQTERRVISGETVPASEKVVSLFEPHTDIIIKDRRETIFGHKICLTGGRSNLIIDCVVLKGNPADSTLALPMLERQVSIWGRPPLKAAMDGGFASKENVRLAKLLGVKDICFAKKRGIEVAEMCRSEYVYNRLRNFRAGIESGISWLKRCFGLGRCTWKGWRSFKSYVWASVVSANLLTLARAGSAA